MRSERRKKRQLRFLITAGPTREPIDPVRYLTNRSSGKMGYALARAATRHGRVTLVSGPTCLTPPPRAKTVRVITAAQMARAILREAKRANVILQCAAVADFTAKPARSKIKKGRGLTLRLKPTLDILATLGRRKRSGQILVGFAAETENLKRNALKKLRSKNLDFIVANRVGKSGTGFDSDYNEITVLAKNGWSKRFRREPKTALASKLLRIFVSDPK